MTDTNGVDNDEIDGRQENQIDEHSQLFSSLNLNDITIEDIEEVIEKDKVGETKLLSKLVGGGVGLNMDASVVAGTSRGGRGATGSANAVPGSSQPQTKIIIQPAQKALRFRYECEGRSAGSIPGANSTPENKTYPTIQVLNYHGQAAVVVSCVTKDAPHRPHPHKLVGKEGCKRGVCTVTINNDNMICSFSNLGIQCVKRKDIDDALRERAEANIDPFHTASTTHRNQVGNIDLNSVRLCFQVFLKGQTGFTKPLPPVVSDPIYDKKSMCDLVICKLSACSAGVRGGDEIIVLCEKIVRDDIQVRFYEIKDGQLIWEGYGDFQPNDVHKQVAISLKTPKYCDTEVTHPVELHIQLRRPSDGTTSDPRAFQFLPADSDPEGLKRKRQKIAKTSFALYLAENAGAPNTDTRTTNPQVSEGAVRRTTTDSRPIRQPHRTRIKMEPPDNGYGAGYSVQQQHQQQHQQQQAGQHAQSVDLRQLPAYYGPTGQLVTNVMDTTSPNTAPYNPQPATTLHQLYVLNPSGYQHQQRIHTPEVITIPSYSSSGSSNQIIYSGSNSGNSKAGGIEGQHLALDQQQQQLLNLSSGSTRLSLGLGSLGSLPLSESTLSIIGSHLSDTFMCLNSDSIEAQLMNSGGNQQQTTLQQVVDYSHYDMIGGQAINNNTTTTTNNNLISSEGREPSMDSFSGLLNQLTQLNQMGAVGGVIMDTTSPQTSIDKYQA